MEIPQAPLEEQINILKKFYEKEYPGTKSSPIGSVILNLLVWVFLILIIINSTKGLGDENG